MAGSERAERKTEGWNNWSAMELRWREKKKKERKEEEKRKDRETCVSVNGAYP